ncbi:MAG TPA: transglycosylase SLT domain-containing protein [Thermoanaerobaculia bacterium]|nr:transglycosylase SLT domain-containing protein [Thermoanaerobaculia bacterium]
MLWLLPLLAAAPLGPPPPSLVELHRTTAPQETLAAAERFAAEAPDVAQRLGASYLRGHALADLGRHRLAAQAFSRAMTEIPELAAHSRLRLAREQRALGHPEVAAGLAAALLDGRHAALMQEAATVLARAIEEGGDCRLLRGVAWQAIAPRERRVLQVARAACASRRGHDAQARGLLLALLQEGVDDEPARQAAERLLGLHPASLGPDLALVLGRAFLQQGRPDLARDYLAPATAAAAAGSRELHEATALLAQAQAGIGDHRAAAATWGVAADSAPAPADRARVGYHQGRSLELAGRRRAALGAYSRAANLRPESRWTGASLLAALRLQRLEGDADEAARLLELLRSRRTWDVYAARGALFLAASDLVHNRADEAGGWLQSAAVTQGAQDREVGYWLGRWEETRGRPVAALGHYLRVLRQGPYHPLAATARERLLARPMRRAVEQRLTAAGESQRLDEQLAAWLLLSPDDPRRLAVERRLYQGLARDPDLGPLLRLAPLEVASWPLWRSPLTVAEDRLLALGLWREVGLHTVLQHFPTRDPRLAYTASRELARGGATARSLLLATTLERRAGGRLPGSLMPRPLRQLLYPLGHGPLVTSAAERHGVDPHLLLALLRVASGFDPAAVAAGGTRGITGLGLADAARAAAAVRSPGLEPADLERPETAIPLAAAHLAGLVGRFGDPPAVVAAYFAGEDEALLWVSWCQGREAAEVLTKLGAREVRQLVAATLESAAAYRELYPQLTAAPQAAGGAAGDRDGR